MGETKQKVLRILGAIVLSFALLVCSNNYNLIIKAYTAKNAVVNGIDLNVRSGPGTEYSTYGTITQGDKVVLIDEARDTRNQLWYKANCTVNGKAITGYVYAMYITVLDDYQSENQNTGKTLRFTASQNIRDNPGTTGTTVIAYGSNGDTAVVLGQKMLDKIWYNISFTKHDGTTITGWTSSQNVVLIESSNSSSGSTSSSGTAQTVEQLVAAGFPESYATKLAELSAKHPTWKFVPVNTGLDWNTAVENESVAGKNLVQSSENDSHKSTESGAYKWETNTWSVYDGSNWVAASKDYIAYRMDPRTYLDEIHIFAFEALSYDSNQTLAGVQSILSGTFMSGSVTDTDGSSLNYAQTFYNLGKELNVSPYHLASRVYQEQGKGTSDLISGTYTGYEGYFNYFNVGAFNTSAGNAILNGLNKAKSMGWNSRYKSLKGGAALLANNYIAVGQDTLYFEKFNVINTKLLYSHQYMSNVNAVYSESYKVSAGYQDKNQSFTFRIPIYNSMPSNTLGFSDTGNPNNYLKTITVTGINLTPSFTGANTSYSAVVGNEISSVTVGATSVCTTSMVSGIGNYNLNIGNNEIHISCTAQNGNKKDYVIKIYRQSEADDKNNNYKIESSDYIVDQFISGVELKTSAADFLSKFNNYNCEVKLYNSDGTENKGNVGTGKYVGVYSNNVLVKKYNVVIYGDINGDGKCSMSDLVVLNRYMLGLTSLSSLAVEAGDVNHNGKTSMSDLVIMNRTSLGLTSFKQK